MRKIIIISTIFVVIYFLPLFIIKSPILSDCSNRNPYIKAIGRYSFKGNVSSISETGYVKFNITERYRVIDDSNSMGDKTRFTLERSGFFPDFDKIFASRMYEEYYIFALYSSKTGGYLVTDCEKVTTVSKLNRVLLNIFGIILTKESLL